MNKYNYEIPDDERIDSLKSKPWFNDNDDKLNTVLNKFAPETHIVAFPHTHIEIYDKLDKCELFDINKNNIKLIEMKTSGCHDNCDILYEKDNSIKIFSGYALSLDGLWRFHSWCIDKDNCIIETTESRLLYYGVCLQKI
jgi:hypothetical protein